MTAQGINTPFLFLLAYSYEDASYWAERNDVPLSWIHVIQDKDDFYGLKHSMIYVTPNAVNRSDRLMQHVAGRATLDDNVLFYC